MGFILINVHMCMVFILINVHMRMVIIFCQLFLLEKCINKFSSYVLKCI